MTETDGGPMILRLSRDRQEPAARLDSGIILHRHKEKSNGKGHNIIEGKDDEEEFGLIEQKHGKFDADLPGDAAPFAVCEFQLVKNEACSFQFALKLLRGIAEPSMFVDEAFWLVLLGTRFFARRRVDDDHTARL